MRIAQNSPQTAQNLAFHSTTIVSIIVVPLFFLPGDVITFNDAALLNFINSDTNNLVALVFTDVTPIISPAGFLTNENSTFTPPALNLTTIPIPAALPLLGSALIGVAGLGYRRKAA